MEDAQARVQSFASEQYSADPAQGVSEGYKTACQLQSADVISLQLPIPDLV